MKHLKFALFVVCALAVSFILGCVLAQAFGIPEYAASVGCAFTLLNFIPKGLEYRYTLNFIDAADIVTEWKALYRQQGQGIKDIMLKLKQKSVTEAYFPRRNTDQTIMEKAVAEFARVLQRFQKAYTPIGGVSFEPLKIALYKLKIDLAEYPDELEESWLGFLADNDLDRKQWPFVKWFLTNALIQQEEDLELLEIYKGVPGTITPGTPTAAGTSLLGIKKQINDFNTAGRLDLKVLGAVPTTDAVLFVEYVEEMVKMIPRLLRNELDYIFMNEDLRDLFRDGMREKYNTQYPQVDEKLITKLRNDNIQIAGLPSMTGSTKLWTTPVWNRQSGLKKSGNPETFKVENVDRQVKAYTDYFKGFGFWVPEYLVSNDVELT
jgi:hypothetical protein